MIQYIAMSEMRIVEALELAKQEYSLERKSCSQLVNQQFEEDIKELILRLTHCKYGMAAVEHGILLGYLAFWGPWDGVFGHCKGVFVL